MSSGAHIWWQPTGASTRVDLDMGRPLTSIEDYEVRDEAIAVAFSGARTRVRFTATRVVDVVCDLIAGTDYNVVRQLEALVNHLNRGGLCSISENDRSLGAYLSLTPDPDVTHIQYNTNLYANFGNYTPLADDILVLSGPSPKMLWEEVAVTSNGGFGVVNLSAAPTIAWDDEAYVFIRNKGFWPVLRLRDGATVPSPLAHGNRITFSLNLPLEVPPDAYDALASTPDDPFPTGGTVDDALEIRLQTGGGKTTIPVSKWW